MIELIKQHYQEIEQLCRNYSVKQLDVFGSGSAENIFDDAKSDLDFLIEFLPLEPTKHAKCYFSVLETLQDIFNRPIDLLELKALNNPYLLDSINKTREKLYAA